MEYRFLFPAEEEMIESAIFYEDRATGLGSDFLNEVQRSIDKICDNPKLGRKESDRIRCTILAKFPYSIFYAVEEGEILILAVSHQKRRPGYWKDR
ncbi:MAG: type II toxin-antitoxin system RelE/ParE family toxin [Acidiferrobacterales bacterium]|nr:type II toxin-antitoxin system RelE/ParE family toxin [Acidiferrobacterales bacterium]